MITVGSGVNGSYGVAVDSAGDVFVANIFSSKVQEIVAGTGRAALGTVNASSTVITLSNAIFYHPGGVAADRAGNVYVSDYDNLFSCVTLGSNAILTHGATSLDCQPPNRRHAGFCLRRHSGCNRP